MAYDQKKQTDTKSGYVLQELIHLSMDSMEKNGDEGMEERRQIARKPYKKTVHCSISVFYNWELKSDLAANIIDITNRGVGIRVCYPVYPGNVLRFDNRLENKSGIVKWSIKDKDSYRAGIKFIIY
jgi:hypothetical protein